MDTMVDEASFRLSALALTCAVTRVVGVVELKDQVSVWVVALITQVQLNPATVALEWQVTSQVFWLLMPLVEVVGSPIAAATRQEWGGKFYSVPPW
jgi:hypothetical protein